MSWQNFVGFLLKNLKFNGNFVCVANEEIMRVENHKIGTKKAANKFI